MSALLAFRLHSDPAGQGGPIPPVRVDVSSRAALLVDLEARLAERRGFSVATLNLDHLVKLRRSPAFRRTYTGQTHVTADGNPIVWLHRLAGERIELVPGSELIEPLCRLAARLGVPVAFLGSTTETLEGAAARLEAAIPGLKVAARIAPPHGLDPEGPEILPLLEQIAASGARLCFLALGAPKQEIIARRGLDRLPDTGFVSIGAGLDFIAGHQRRAPVWVRRMAMEWAWRMASNPRRLARRYLDCALILPGLGVSALRARRGPQDAPAGPQGTD